MKTFFSIVWLLIRALILAIALLGVLGGGVCSVMLASSGPGDAMTASFLTFSLIVLGVSAVVALIAYLSLKKRRPTAPPPDAPAAEEPPKEGEGW